MFQGIVAAVVATLPVIDFDPRPVKYREVKAMHVNGFLGALQALSMAVIYTLLLFSDGGHGFWEQCLI